MSWFKVHKIPIPWIKLETSKLQIVKDGQVQGWFVALCLTINTYILLDLALLSGKEQFIKAWKDMGGIYEAIFGISMGSWFVYKGIKAVGNGRQKNNIVPPKKEDLEC